MLKVAVTVSTKATYSHNILKCFFTLFTASLGLVEKGIKKALSIH